MYFDIFFYLLLLLFSWYQLLFMVWRQYRLKPMKDHLTSSTTPWIALYLTSVAPILPTCVCQVWIVWIGLMCLIWIRMPGYPECIRFFIILIVLVDWNYDVRLKFSRQIDIFTTNRNYDGRLKLSGKTKIMMADRNYYGRLELWISSDKSLP